MGKSVREQASCPLSGIRKCPVLGGCICITAIGISICATDFVRCREVVCFSEDPLWEVRLYSHFPEPKCTSLIMAYFPNGIYS